MSRMKKTFPIIWCLLFALFPAQRGNAQSEDGGVEGIFSFGTGADMVGRGQAGVARPSESSALYWNPAYLDRIAIANANFFHTSFLGDTPYNFFSVSYPTLHIGTFAAGLFRISTGDIQGTDDYGVRTEKFSYSQYEYLFSYGRKADFLLEGSFLEDSYLGLSLKVDNQQMFGESATGIGLDVGYNQPLDRLHSGLAGVDVGLVVRNAIAPSLRLSQASEDQTRQLAFGAARSFAIREGHKVTPFFDVVKHEKRVWREKVGAEYDYMSLLKLRAGINAEAFSFGMGVLYKSFGFDYALRNSDYMTSHLFSLSYTFGKTRQQMQEEEAERERKRIESEAQQRLEKQRTGEIEKRVAEAQRLTREGDFFAALGQWQGVLAWDEDNEQALAAIHDITEELHKQQEEASTGMATKAAAKELFEAGIMSYTQKRYSDAISSWSRVLEIDPNHDLSREYILKASGEMESLIAQHTDRASALERGGDYPSALNELHTALRYDAGNGDIQKRITLVENRIRSNDRFRRGLASYLSGDYDSAIADLRKALELNPGNTMISEYIQLAESRKTGARTGVVGRSEIQPEMEKLYLEGVDLYLQGKYAEAVEAWRKVLEDDPNNTKVTRNIEEAEQRIEALRSLEAK
jgi:tetratricopeptide (TPR) repeat protein